MRAVIGAGLDCATENGMSMAAQPLQDIFMQLLVQCKSKYADVSQTLDVRERMW